MERLDLSMILGLCLDRSKKENEIIFLWLNIFNALIYNLFLPSRVEKDELELKKICNDFRFVHIDLCDLDVKKKKKGNEGNKVSQKKVNKISKINIESEETNSLNEHESSSNILQKEKNLFNFMKEYDYTVESSYGNIDFSKSRKRKVENYYLNVPMKKIKKNRIRIERSNKKVRIFRKKIKRKKKKKSEKAKKKKKKPEKLFYLLRQSNIHYLRHLPKCVRKNGSIFTFFFALERYHQYFKMKKYNIKKKGLQLLKFFIEHEIIRKIRENSVFSFEYEKTKEKLQHISIFLKFILDNLNIEKNNFYQLKSFVFNKHIFKIGVFVCTFDNRYFFIKEIFQEKNSDRTFILAQELIKIDNKYYLKNQKSFHIITPFFLQRIINLIPENWERKVYQDIKKTIVKDKEHLDQEKVEMEKKKGSNYPTNIEEKTEEVDELDEINIEINIETVEHSKQRLYFRFF
ncbi:heat shock protein [Anaeramoeba flamelloides]|uniref:Heat shock protein n=1 Tax=Anaeramoeba flamelloides TaxID=1746091 RepID=A0ABQ8XAE1_9EUKA|nr:heat shock protein [Anaeramoeba flamelloides]